MKKEPEKTKIPELPGKDPKSPVMKKWRKTVSDIVWTVVYRELKNRISPGANHESVAAARSSVASAGIGGLFDYSPDSSITVMCTFSTALNELSRKMSPNWVEKWKDANASKNKGNRQ